MQKDIQSNDIQVFIHEEIVNESTKAILLIHGFCEHSGRYTEFIKNLKEEGYSVLAMDLRGHGRTTGKKGDLQSIKKVISDVEKVIDYIKENYKFEKIGIFGHSTGGLIASLYSSLYSENIDFIILSSPAIYTPQKLKIINFIPYKLIKFIHLLFL